MLWADPNRRITAKIRLRNTSRKNMQKTENATAAPAPA